MNSRTSPRFSLVIPSRGDRHKALSLALDHIEAAARKADLLPRGLEVLVGFDGLRGERVRDFPYVTYYDFPKDNDFGNAIRHGLLKAAKGERIIFHDDDNILTEDAFLIHETYPEAEMVIARIDVSRAFDKPYLPEIVPGREIVRQCNIDPLCLCLARDLVVNRCGGWQGQKYEADFVNIVRYFRRARSVEVTESVVGIYDAGCGLDQNGLNFRQTRKD